MTYEQASSVIRELFSNTDYSVEEARENLQGLRDEIEMLLDTLPDDE